MLFDVTFFALRVDLADATNVTATYIVLPFSNTVLGSYQMIAPHY